MHFDIFLRQKRDRDRCKGECGKFAHECEKLFEFFRRQYGGAERAVAAAVVTQIDRSREIGFRREKEPFFVEKQALVCGGMHTRRARSIHAAPERVELPLFNGKQKCVEIHERKIGRAERREFSTECLLRNSARIEEDISLREEPEIVSAKSLLGRRDEILFRNCGSSFDFNRRYRDARPTRKRDQPSKEREDKERHRNSQKYPPAATARA